MWSFSPGIKIFDGKSRDGSTKKVHKVETRAVGIIRYVFHLYWVTIIGKVLVMFDVTPCVCASGKIISSVVVVIVVIVHTQIKAPESTELGNYDVTHVIMQEKFRAALSSFMNHSFYKFNNTHRMHVHEARVSKRPPPA